MLVIQDPMVDIASHAIPEHLNLKEARPNAFFVLLASTLRSSQRHRAPRVLPSRLHCPVAFSGAIVFVTQGTLVQMVANASRVSLAFTN